MKGVLDQVELGNRGSGFSWVTDELNDLGGCHITSVVLAFIVKVPPSSTHCHYFVSIEFCK